VNLVIHYAHIASVGLDPKVNFFPIMARRGHGGGNISTTTSSGEVYEHEEATHEEQLMHFCKT
jgi:hypothetical protein